MLRVDYSLLGFLTRRHGGVARKTSSCATRPIVLDPAKAPPDEEVVKDQKITLPAFFPDRLTLSDVNLRVKSQPQDLVLEHLNLTLNPTRRANCASRSCSSRAARAGAAIAATTTYENRNLFLRDLVLDDQTRIDVVNIDASKVGDSKLDVVVKGTVVGGQIDGTFALGEQDKSLGAEYQLRRRKHLARGGDEIPRAAGDRARPHQGAGDRYDSRPEPTQNDTAL